MSNLLDLLTDQLGGNTLQAISGQLGADENQVQSAVGTALPLILSALARNSANDEGANSLNNALADDHDGSILDDLAGFIGNSQQGPGAGILKHVLGDRRTNIEKVIGGNSGLSQNQTSGLMEMLAPVVMGVLGKQKRQSALNANGIASLLGTLANQNQKRNPQSMGLIGSLLDSDGDGSINDDIAKIGMKYLGNMLFKRRK
ncbi:MAG: DUF937 domain-containing protein [Bacteroidota bacterium]